MSKAISKAIGIVVTVICVIGSITTIFAQDGNGISNPDSYSSDTSNWCDGGGVWGPELCNSGQLAPPEWMYQAGWYWQRVIEGDISVAQVPEPYRGNTNLSSSDNGDGTVTITVQTPTGPRTITIVLLGASGTNRHPNAPATADHELNQDNFDAPSEGAGLGINADDNLVIYGNSANNSITGGDGDDTIHGGDEFAANTGARIGDTINGGPGNDTLNGGNESTSGFNVQAGDTINGGPGDDVINGGDETCNGAFCDALGGGSCDVAGRHHRRRTR
jgi:Ca2+-binding RTX toxin-like protein